MVEKESDVKKISIEVAKILNLGMLAEDVTCRRESGFKWHKLLCGQSEQRNKNDNGQWMSVHIDRQVID